jgi:hypothetical protein
MNWSFSTAGTTKRAAVHAVGAIVALAAMVAFFQGIYAPLHSEAADRSIRIEKVRELTSFGGRIAREHRETVQRLDRLTIAAEETRGRMPTDLSTGEFVEQATRLAADLGLTVEQFQTGIPQTSADVTTIDVSCRLVGSFASTCRFLAAIDQLSQVTKVWRLDVARTANSEGYPVQVTFQLYYQVDPHDKDQQRGTL